MSIPRNHIEIRSNDTTAPGHVANTVLIDGNEVLLEEDGIDLDFGSKQFTVVTLRILASRITFN